MTRKSMLQRRWRTKLLLGRERPSILPIVNRLTAGAATGPAAGHPLCDPLVRGSSHGL
jgi:hypothetical protein